MATASLATYCALVSVSTYATRRVVTRRSSDDPPTQGVTRQLKDYLPSVMTDESVMTRRFSGDLPTQ
jgi:hypothetical protein